MTNIGVLSFGGAEMMTFLHPPPKCLPALSRVVKTPVDSQTYSAPDSPHLIPVGSLSWKTATLTPLITKLVPSATTVPGHFPWTESYLN